MDPCGGDYADEDASPPDTADAALRLLADPLRRFVLSRLVEEPTNVASVDDLVGTYAERTGREPEDVAIECHHAVIPTLADADLVEFDEASGDVRYYPDPLVDRLLAIVERHEP